MFSEEEMRGDREDTPSGETTATGGFYYYVDDEILEAFRQWPPEQRLLWLEHWNRFLTNLPPEIRQRQERFRKGEI